MNSKQRFVDLFLKKEVDRVPVVPLVYSFAAQLKGLSAREMLENPTNIANSLRDAQELFDTDGVVTSFDLTLEAEACGCDIAWPDDGPPVVSSHPFQQGKSADDLQPQIIDVLGRIPVVVDVTRRLVAITGREKALLAVATGPLTLFRHLKGSTFSQVMNEDSSEAEAILDFSVMITTRMVQVYGNLGLDAIVVADENLSDEEFENLPDVFYEYESLWDIARYFNSISVYLTGKYPVERLEAIVDGIGSDCVVLRDEPHFMSLRDNAPETGPVLGCGVPAGRLLDDPEEIRMVVERDIRACESTGSFLCTDWEVPHNAPIESVHVLMEAARRT